MWGRVTGDRSAVWNLGFQVNRLEAENYELNRKLEKLAASMDEQARLHNSQVNDLHCSVYRQFYSLPRRTEKSGSCLRRSHHSVRPTGTWCRLVHSLVSSMAHIHPRRRQLLTWRLLCTESLWSARKTGSASQQVKWNKYRKFFWKLHFSDSFDTSDTDWEAASPSYRVTREETEERTVRRMLGQTEIWGEGVADQANCHKMQQ